MNRLPRHWTSFVRDALEELKNVTNKVYEGQVTKGVRNGIG
jgi:hypothetical protein